MSDIVDAHVAWMRRERRFAKRTISDRRRLLGCLERELPKGLEIVSRDDVEAFLYRDEWGEWTRKTYYTHVVGFFRWAADPDPRVNPEGPWMTADPTVGMKAPPGGPNTPKPITDEEVRMALGLLVDPWRMAVMLAALAGLRASEIADLLREDVTAEFVHVRRGKGGRERWVDTTDLLWAYVQPRPSGPLVRHPRTGGAVDGHWLSSRQHYWWRRIGMRHVHLHRLRHTFGDALVEAGHDLLVVRDLMGHASVATTQGYVQVSASRRRAAVASLDRMLERHEPDTTRLVPPAAEAA